MEKFKLRPIDDAAKTGEPMIIKLQFGEDEQPDYTIATYEKTEGDPFTWYLLEGAVHRESTAVAYIPLSEVIDEEY